MAPLVRGRGLDLHARHVHTRGAFALAALAGDAVLERLAHRLAGVVLALDLARERQAQRVGAAARDVALASGGAVAGAHGPGVELAAMAVVVAHLDRAGEGAPVAPIQR